MRSQYRVLCSVLPGLVVLACGGNTLPGAPVGSGGSSGGGSGSAAGGQSGGSALTGGRASGGSSQSGGATQSGGRASGGIMSGGNAGSAGSGTGGKIPGTGSSAGSGGEGGAREECALIECFRAVECVESCGGPVVSSGCCPCGDGTFDRIECGQSGGASSGGAAGASGGAGTAGVAGQGGSPSGGAGGRTSTSPNPGPPYPDIKGTGACAKHTLSEVIAEVHRLRPDLAKIDMVRDPKQMSIGNAIGIFVTTTAQGFRLVFQEGSGDCPAGCIDYKYWYFETNRTCVPEQVGYYSRIYSGAGNCFTLRGAPLWNTPPARPDGVCEAPALSELNTECIEDSCSPGLEPVHFYGIAGAGGPEFCWCTIRCDSGKSCPAGTACVTVSDGPGEVCAVLDK